MIKRRQGKKQGHRREYEGQRETIQRRERGRKVRECVGEHRATRLVEAEKKLSAERFVEDP